MPSSADVSGGTDNEEAPSPILSHKHAPILEEARHALKGPARLWVFFAEETRFKDSMEDTNAQLTAIGSSSPSSANLDVSIYVTQKRSFSQVAESDDQEEEQDSPSMSMLEEHVRGGNKEFSQKRKEAF